MIEVEKTTVYSPSNDTYDVTNYAKGPDYEILKGFGKFQYNIAE